MLGVWSEALVAKFPNKVPFRDLAVAALGIAWARAMLSELLPLAYKVQ